MKFDNYSIRPLTTDDLVPYFKMVERNRKRLEEFFTGTVSRTKTIDDTQAFLADITERAKARTYMPYLIIDEENGKFAGFLDLKNIDWSIPKSEVGCYMDKDYAGKGVATKAFQLFCEYCFNTFGFRKLFLRTHESNTAAKQMAEHNGFEKEGILRWDYKTTSGQLVDLIYYGRLRG
ncbi:MAG: GNAT family protein [Chitinophagaceae bacterium]